MKNNTNGTIEFHPNGRGTWKGRTWNGEEFIFWKGIFLSRGEAENFAESRGYRAAFVTE